MGFQDKRLLVPGILTVFSNFFFAILLFMEGKTRLGAGAHGATSAVDMSQAAPAAVAVAKHGLHHGRHAMDLAKPEAIQQFIGQTALNGPWDQSGFGALQAAATPDAILAVVAILGIWWLTNRFLEGVTTALVYSHLTEGAGTGKFTNACAAVFTSLPAIIALGFTTLIAKRVARFMRDKRGSGIFGMGVNFLSSVVEVFWTLAGHLILPAIVIEGTSFWGALKRADRIAQGNLIAIGVGEIGIDTINRVVLLVVCLAGVSGFSYAYVQHMVFSSPAVLMGGAAWAATVIVVTAMSIYIRAAFFTCLYVWAIEAEALSEAERVNHRAPGPLAAALA
jgi:hypothetical protein